MKIRASGPAPQPPPTPARLGATPLARGRLPFAAALAWARAPLTAEVEANSSTARARPREEGALLEGTPGAPARALTRPEARASDPEPGSLALPLPLTALPGPTPGPPAGACAGPPPPVPELVERFVHSLRVGRGPRGAEVHVGVGDGDGAEVEVRLRETSRGAEAEVHVPAGTEASALAERIADDLARSGAHVAITNAPAPRAPDPREGRLASTAAARHRPPA